MQTVTPPPRFVNVPSVLLYREDLDPRVLRTLLRIYGMHWDARIKPRLKARDWQKVAGATTVGYKRILRFDDTTTQKVRLKIIQSRVCPTISNFGLFYAPPIKEILENISERQ